MNVSSRGAGKIDKNGKVTMTHIFSYDIVADPGFGDAILDSVERKRREAIKMKRQERKAKLQKLFGNEHES